MIKRFNANQARLRRHRRMRSHFEGSQARPRLNVFRSGKHIYAQIIDDTTGVTLAAASSIDESLRSFKPVAPAPVVQPNAEQTTGVQERPVELAAQAVPGKGKGAKTEKAAQKAP